MANIPTHKAIIGRAALLDLPELKAKLIPAKTDSGAYRSAIHAQDIQVIERDGKKVLIFTLFGGHPSAGQSIKSETDNFKLVEVENSFGHREKRYEIKLLTIVANKRFRTSFTLADRSKKIYPVLMGRRLLNNRFLIDTSLTQIDRRILRKNFKVNLPQDEEEQKI